MNKSDKNKKKDPIDNPVSRDKIADNPGIIQFPHHIGSFVIKPEDKGRIKGNAMAAMKEQTDRQMAGLYEQMQLLMRQANDIKKRVEVSEKIYLANINFEPVINHIYFLYRRKDKSTLLSMISPEEWGRELPYENFIAKVRLLADHTWEIVESIG